MTGDITINNAGLTAIGAGKVVDAQINAAAGIDFSKLAALTSGNILVGSAGNVPTSVAMSGAGSLNNAGVLSLNPGYAVQTAVVTMTASQVVGAYATPVALIPAPTAGFGILLLNAAVVTEVSTAFATGGVAIVEYGNVAHGAGTNALSATIPAAEINAASSQVYSMTGYIATTVTATSAISGLGVYFSNATGAFTVGTGSTVTISLAYMVLPIV
jgi:hypothetical protein